MPLQLTDPQIWLRLMLTVIAGALLGLNRGAHGTNLVLDAEGATALSSPLAALISPLGYHAQWQCQTRPQGSRTSHLGFAVHWRRPEIAGPPLDLLRVVNEHFAVISFETEYEDHS
jgi:hypothetical protein